jgi:hypothetical protein
LRRQCIRKASDREPFECEGFDTLFKWSKKRRRVDWLVAFQWLDGSGQMKLVASHGAPVRNDFAFRISPGGGKMTLVFSGGVGTLGA